MKMIDEIRFRARISSFVIAMIFVLLAGVTERLEKTSMRREIKEASLQ